MVWPGATALAWPGAVVGFLVCPGGAVGLVVWPGAVVGCFVWPGAVVGALVCPGAVVGRFVWPGAVVGRLDVAAGTVPGRVVPDVADPADRVPPDPLNVDEVPWEYVAPGRASTVSTRVDWLSGPGWGDGEGEGEGSTTAGGMNGRFQPAGTPSEPIASAAIRTAPKTASVTPLDQAVARNRRSRRPDSSRKTGPEVAWRASGRPAGVRPPHRHPTQPS